MFERPRHRLRTDRYCVEFLATLDPAASRPRHAGRNARDPSPHRGLVGIRQSCCQTGRHQWQYHAEDKVRLRLAGTNNAADAFGAGFSTWDMLDEAGMGRECEDSHGVRDQWPGRVRQLRQHFDVYGMLCFDRLTSIFRMHVRRRVAVWE